MPIIDHIPKSLLCKFFAANQCERGTACTFAHSLDELNHIPEQDLSRKEGKFNAWDGELSPAGLIPNVRECTTTMSWAIWCLKNERTVPDWVLKLYFQATVQHGYPFLKKMQKVLQATTQQERLSRSRGRHLRTQQARSRSPGPRRSRSRARSRSPFPQGYGGRRGRLSLRTQGRGGRPRQLSLRLSQQRHLSPPAPPEAELPRSPRVPPSSETEMPVPSTKSPTSIDEDL